ncbi:MAG: MFS transporter, partial [Tistlia sp.]
WLADRWGRKTLMAASLLGAAVLGLLVVAAPDWSSHLALRTLLGIALAGVPAVAMVYLAEEMEPDAFGFSMGLYIGGNAIGGMAGRLLVGLLADFTSWRLALGALTLLVLVNAGLFWWLLPRPRHSPARRIGLADFLASVRGQFADRGLPWLFAEAFLIMGSFVALYNYIGFRLLEPPYGLSQAAISLVFLVYLIGTGASAWIGALAQRLGRRRMLWLMIVIMGAGLALNCLPTTPAAVAGLVVFTFGFFGAHSIASSWVARRARSGKAQATALYLFFYYLGSSALGTLGGYAWNHWAWTGVALVIGGAILVALAIAVRLFYLAPLATTEEPPPAPP